MYALFRFMHSFYVHKEKTAILHLRFSAEKNRRLGSKKARYNRAFRWTHLYCVQVMVGEDGFEPSKPKQQIYSLSPLTTRELSQIQRWLLYHRTGRMSRGISNFLRDFWDCAPRRGMGGSISISARRKNGRRLRRGFGGKRRLRVMRVSQSDFLLIPDRIVPSASSSAKSKNIRVGRFLSTSRNFDPKRISV